MDSHQNAQFKEALQYIPLPDGTVKCSLCNHRCHIKDTSRGRCGIRRNLSGRLIAESYARVSAEAVDPIEKKPLNHFLPGTTSYSLGSIGCNFSCAHCQNWHISQPGEGDIHLKTILPEEGVNRACAHRCSSISWTYNEPTMWYEYTREMAEIARANSLGTIYVTNGYMTEEALEELSPHLNAWRIDLKAFSEDFYRTVCKAHLQPVLDTTIRAHELGLHIETVTLIIPGLNDDIDEMKRMIRWVIDNLGPDTPMHFTRFHPDFKMTDRPATPIRTLEKIYELAHEMGLHYPYLGNVNGHRYEHTYCPTCGEIVIARSGYLISTELLQGTQCGHCNTDIAVIRKV
ncbi:MAG: AmmeMemoRadiSam system radical SAM enzyme [Methanomicrobiales archaeon HGW-Methanomicrobiales-4]|nr:MAG: AmmeMemoRadiSam system radical SAM enzyme [Methanomicrobiales archaeon HGW-Methanomicrobiales-4]